jgi:hypothetical protein
MSMWRVRWRMGRLGNSSLLRERRNGWKGVRQILILWFVITTKNVANHNGSVANLESLASINNTAGMPKSRFSSRRPYTIEKQVGLQGSIGTYIGSLRRASTQVETTW